MRNDFSTKYFHVRVTPDCWYIQRRVDFALSAPFTSLASLAQLKELRALWVKDRAVLDRHVSEFVQFDPIPKGEPDLSEGMKDAVAALLAKRGGKEAAAFPEPFEYRALCAEVNLIKSAALPDPSASPSGSAKTTGKDW